MIMIMIKLIKIERWSYNDHLHEEERLSQEFLAKSKKIKTTSLDDPRGGERITVSFWEVPEDAVVEREIFSTTKLYGGGISKESKIEHIPAKELVCDKIFEFPPEKIYLFRREEDGKEIPVNLEDCKPGDILLAYVGHIYDPQKDFLGEIQFENIFPILEELEAQYGEIGRKEDLEVEPPDLRKLIY